MYCAIDLFYNSIRPNHEIIMLTIIVHRMRDCVGIIAGVQHIDGHLQVK